MNIFYCLRSPGSLWLLLVLPLNLLLAIPAGASAEASPDINYQLRQLPLHTVSNARDLGGYTTADGRAVKWGLLFRTGSLGKLDNTDLGYLQQLQLAVVTDFRSAAERASMPDRLPQQSPAIAYKTLAINDPAVDVAQLSKNLFSGKLSQADLIALTDRSAYINKPELSLLWGQWLASLVAPGNLPQLFHCTAGKDRTGFAAAIVLLTLGVPKEQVMEDFLLSNHYRKAEIDAGLQAIQANATGEVDEQLLRQVLGVSPQSLEGAILAMEQKYGSIDAFIERGLGIDSATRASLQALLLE